jgi:hypothetical protein
MSGGRRPAWSDTDILNALDMVEREGRTCAAAGRALGYNKNAVIGMLRRVRLELAAVPDLACKPENRDGGMPPRWWAGMQP